MEINPDQLIKRKELRESATIGRSGVDLYWIPFEQIAIRTGFNVRINYTGIRELANSIVAVGLHDPMTVDIMEDEQSFVEIGHRRYMALELLNKEGKLATLDVRNIKHGKIGCYKNPSNTTELDRILNLITSNSGEPLTDFEKIRVANRLKENYGMTNKEIAERLGMSRQSIDNLLILASAPKEVHKAVDVGVLTTTAAVDLLRKVKDEEKVKEIVTGAVSDSKVIKVSDVKNMNTEGEVTKPVTRFTNDSGTYIGGDNDKAETKARKTDDKIRGAEPPKDTDDEESSLKGGRMTEAKDEEVWLGEVIGNLDKINNMVGKTKNEGLIKDVDNLVRFSIQKIEAVREFVRKSPAKSISK